MCLDAVRCSMRTRFANAALHADAFFVIRAISTALSLTYLTKNVAPKQLVLLCKIEKRSWRQCKKHKSERKLKAVEKLCFKLQKT